MPETAAPISIAIPSLSRPWKSWSSSRRLDVQGPGDVALAGVVFTEQH
jgi:hypothetical protein